MGVINFGIPKKETRYLKEKMNLDVFVEGGTYKGYTAEKMSENFKKVFTIEKSEVMFDVARSNLKTIKNIIMLKGDTRDHLHTILEKNNNILFWLDAHWSGGMTYGEEDECPLLEELEIIFKYNKNYVILIDDARLFLAPPPSPHKIGKWPSLKNILQVLPSNWELIEFEDVIYLFPNQINEDFKNFIQEIVTEKWNKYGKSNRERILKVLYKIYQKFLNIK